MEKLPRFLKRTSKKEQRTFQVAEGGIRNQSDMYKEYEALENETRCMISFEGWCKLRKKMKC